MILELHYIDGSPFARIARILIKEHDLDVKELEIHEFPPPKEFLTLNPMGQVPVLVDGDRAYFPTSIVVEALLSLAADDSAAVARSVTRKGHRLYDEQIMNVIYAMGDALVLHHYLEWAGVAPVGRNRLGFDPAERSLIRVYSTLDWLENRITPDGFQSGVISVQDIGLACFIFWANSRGPIEWQGRPKIEALIERLEKRKSFLATAPRPHVLK